MKSLGLLIPEFPGQTHAFFIRERAALEKLGLRTVLISTRRPVAASSQAHHEWVQEAAAETVYLFPMPKGETFKSLLTILAAGPLAWLRCLKILVGHSDASLKERVKMFGFILAGAYLKRVCQQQDIPHVHVHSCANAANVALFARLLGGASYSMTLHGPMQDYGSNQAHKWCNASFCVVITKELVAEVKDKLGNYDLPPLYLAPMGVNIDDFKRGSAYTPAEPGQIIKLVSCGRLNYVKAHDDLIRTVALLKESGTLAHLTICGATDSYSEAENYLDKLKDLCAELSVSEQVSFLGSVSEARVKQELEGAHFFCLASLKEPLGVAIMEAMAMEIPAIVARSPGVSEMIDDGVDGVLVSPRAPEQFVAAINTLIPAPDEAIRLATEGRKKVVEKFHSGISAETIAKGCVKRLSDASEPTAEKSRA